MVRGIQFLLIITIFRQAITGSEFDQFSTPEKKDKNKMLMYLRGLLKSPTTVKAMTKQIPATIAPVPINGINIEELWDGNNLPDRSDKSKMLAYLRGIKAPSSMFSVYEDPQHRGLISTLENTDNKPNTYNNQNPGDLSDTAQHISWRGPDTATHASFLPPVYYKEGDSDTCFWRGQQSGDQHKLVGTETKDDKGVKKGGEGEKKDKNDKKDKKGKKDKKDKTKEVAKGPEDIEDKISNFLNCMRTKYWKSYYRIKKKVCSMFDG